MGCIKLRHEAFYELILNGIACKEYAIIYFFLLFRGKNGFLLCIFGVFLFSARMFLLNIMFKACCLFGNNGKAWELFLIILK